MTSERQLENYSALPERPETSKFSRNSRRSDFHMTFSDFNPNSDGPSKPQVPFNKKGELQTTQTKFYSSKTQFLKNNSFNSTFYPSDKSSHKKRQVSLNDCSLKDDKVSCIKETDSVEFKVSSKQDFFVSNEDLKKGVTLDKVLGGSFKKIELFDSNLKEFGRSATVTDKIIEETIDEMSECEDKEYQYESFEILESDNEDEISEASQSKKKKNESKTQLRGTFDIDENHEVLSKIQNKYKSSKPKFLPKTNLKGFKNKPFPKDKKTCNDNNMCLSEEIEIRKDTISSNCEAKNLSPRFGGLISKVANNGLSNPKSYFETPQNVLIEIEPNISLTKNPSSPSRLGIQYQHQDVLRKNSNPLSITNENFRVTNEKFRTTLMKQTFYNKTSMNPVLGESYDYEPEQDLEKEKANLRARNLIGSLRPLENIMKFQVDKAQNNTLEQKFIRENKMITEKIKQTETEMMNKYAKMFKLDQKEVMNLCPDKAKKSAGSKRLSTPLKDINFTRNFQKRKIINL